MLPRSAEATLEKFLMLCGFEHTERRAKCWSPARAILCCGLLFVSPLFSQVQQFRFSNLTLQDGISGYRVFNICQDAQGFIWIATAYGLDRYDGSRIRTFRQESGDPFSPSASKVSVLFVDSRGTLWAGTSEAGLNKYNPLTETFVHYTHNPQEASTVGSNAIVSLAEAHGTLWVATSARGIDAFDRERGTFSHYRHDPRDSTSLSSDSVNALAVSPSGVLWIATKAGLDALDKQANRFLHYTVPAEQHTASRAINNLMVDRSGVLWLISDAGLYTFSPEQGILSRMTDKLHNIAVHCLYEQDTRHVWLGTDKGLRRLDRSTSRWHEFVHDASRQASLANDFIFHITGDSSGNVWVATDGGVSRFSPRVDQFQHYALDDQQEENGDVSAVVVDANDSMWFGTKKGLATLRVLNDGRPQEGSYRSVAKSGFVQSLCVDSSGKIWAGSYGSAALSSYDPRTKQLRTYAIGTDVLSLSCDRDERLWLGADDGLKLFDSRRGKLLTLAPAIQNIRSRVLAIIQRRNTAMVIATEGEGMFVVDPYSFGYRQFKHEPSDPMSISHNRTYAVHEDRAGRVWVATAEGLDLFDDSAGSFRHYKPTRISKGLTFIQIVEDNGGRLWLSTIQSGLFRFDPLLSTFHDYGAAEGIQGSEFHYAAARMRSGVLIFGGKNGFNMFHPDSIVENRRPPPVVITSFRPLGKSDTRANRISLAPPEFSFTQNQFIIEFAALDFGSPGDNRFLYKLEPSDTGWVDPGEQRSLVFPGLAPNHYVFRIKAANNDGVWNEQGVSIPIVINPPFYKTWQFISLMVLVAGGIIAAVYNYRTRQQLAVERLRVRIASDLHDDVGSSLSGIALMSDLVRSHLPKGTKDHTYLEKLSSSARNTAETLRDIVWVINPEHDTAEDILLRMKAIADMLLVKSQFTFSAPSNGLSGLLNMEYRRNLLLIYREILNNTAKHAQAKNVAISIATNENHLTLQIVDDGIGFDVEAVRAKGGHGLFTQQHRAEKINGTIDIQSAPGKGTTTTLVVKIPRLRYGKNFRFLVFSKQNESRKQPQSSFTWR
jgi:ligand-binding sensor domain-containing protein